MQTTRCWAARSPRRVTNRRCSLIPEVPARRVVLRRPAVAAIAATFLPMGVVVAAYGPLLELLTRRFGLSLPVAGPTISVHFAGGLSGVLVPIRAMERLAARTAPVWGAATA